MIAGTYILSGVLLIITGILFKNGTLTATTQTVAWCIIFFFASAGASAAYLTVAEIFPMETRAMAIAFFYATGTIVGGFGGPLLFGALIQSGEPGPDLHRLRRRRGRDDHRRRHPGDDGRRGRRSATSRTSPRRCRRTGDELDEPGEEADPYTLGRGEGRGTSDAARFGATERRPTDPSDRR